MIFCITIVKSLPIYINEDVSLGELGIEAFGKENGLKEKCSQGCLREERTEMSQRNIPTRRNRDKDRVR